jgi:hypothetical protein
MPSGLSAPREQEQPVQPSPPNEPGLGSLAQSARGKQLNQARWLLIVIGLLTLGINGFILVKELGEVRDAVAAGRIPRGAVNTVYTLVYVIDGGAAALGLLFVIFGLIIKMFPVPITIISLILYILAAVGFAMLNFAFLERDKFFETLWQGIIVKVIIIVAFIKAIQAAIAYERDKQIAQARLQEES